MKIVWKILCVICVLLGALGAISDLVEGSFSEDTALTVMVMLIFAGIFGYLAWIWRSKSPVKRAAEQMSNVAEAMKESNEAYKEMSKSLKRRAWRYRIVGIIVAAFGIRLWPLGNWSSFWISVGAVVLIIGIAIIFLGSPNEYNASTDVGAMITFNRKMTIEEIYEAFKNIETPLGSCYLGHFRTMKQPAMIYGPADGGDYLYFWLTKGGEIGFLGSSFLEGFIKDKINEPLIPAKSDFGENTAAYICYHSDLILLQKQLKESLENYAKTGQPLLIARSQPSQVYTFTEDFKLTGQHFSLCDQNEEVIYEVDGTVPLINLYIYDKEHMEIFRLTKEIGHALATYHFYYKGELYGTLEKQFALIRDKFKMQVKEGTLELTEYAGSIGNNYTVALNGRMIGAIMDDLNLTIHNLIFDNAVVIAYDDKYLPLLTAMAVMVAREIARDEEDE